jgi:hypothetical protein
MTRAMPDTLAAVMMTIAALVLLAATSPAQRPENQPAGRGLFVELTTLQGSAARTITSKDAPTAREFSPDERSRWILTNPYQPTDRRFFSFIFHIAPGPDGTLFLAAKSVAFTSETGRRPRASIGDPYGDNGTGVWRMDADGRVTAYAVRADFDLPGQSKDRLQCDTDVVESVMLPSQWGGMAVAQNGDVYISDRVFSVILKLDGKGRVERVAGGGEQGCVQNVWNKNKEIGYRDGPARQALFKGPRGLAFDREGHLLVGDYGNCALRKIDLASGTVSTLHKGCYVDPKDNGNYDKWILYDFLTVDPQGRPVAGGSRFSVQKEQIFTTIHRLNPDGRYEQLLSAHKGYANSGRLLVEWLGGLAFLPDGTLLLADTHNNLLRTLSGGRLSDWLGHPHDDWDSDVDGPAAQARIAKPGGLAVTTAGTIYIAPGPGNGLVRKVDGKTRAVSSWLY